MRSTHWDRVLGLLITGVIVLNVFGERNILFINAFLSLGVGIVLFPVSYKRWV
ncbi:hypothetical protein [Pajaroellobacter abortibovis]|uniref:hypothetical protein n=1 Tax=Pajaroellobacter abortibovis TaxID=1882918 RepID=UPI0012EC3384|nr:hypothetical protein [Pajaroellobacter abortibovis]